MIRTASLAAFVLLATACGGSTESSGAHPILAGDAGDTRDAAVSGGGASNGGGGASSGGASNGGASNGGATGLVSCDTRKVLCRSLPPTCTGEMEVPSVDGSCFGRCVPIEQCACAAAEDCPDANQYTCLRSAKHCTPYLR